jgi:serine/threonine protein kinase
VRYNAFIQDQGYDILIMEFLGGGTLHQKLKSGNLALPIPGAKIYWDQLARAIKFLHNEKVMHRDIKPANILFNLSGELKLCDFGISKQLPKHGDTTGTQLGTPHYAAPEIFEGQSYSFPTDIWSLGIVVLDMLRLSPPKLESWLIAGSDDSAWNRWLSTIRDIVQGLPQDLDLLRGQLTEDPKLRPTGDILVESLRRTFTQVGSSSNAVMEVRKMKRGALDQAVIQKVGKRKAIPK